MRIVLITGARPQFVKIASIIRELKDNNIEYHHIHTGQHYDYEMSEQIFKDLDIPVPDTRLQPNFSQNNPTAELMSLLEPVIKSISPDMVLVVGDTNSTFAGAYISVRLHIPVIHVESGLRSHDWQMPEEINRILVDRISSILITYTQKGYDNLVKEGIDINRIFVSNDPMVTSLEYATYKVKKPKYSNYALLTLHRQENVDDYTRLKTALDILEKSPLPIIFPIHPRTQKRIKDFGLTNYSNFTMLPPMGYIDFISLQKHASVIITDSGGIQKEAFVLKKPCITLRSTTEWVETINLGVNRLFDIVAKNESGILSSIQDVIDGRFVVSIDHPYNETKLGIVDIILYSWERKLIKLTNTMMS